MRTVGAKDDCGSALCIRDMAIWRSTWGVIFALAARNISKAVRSSLYNASIHTSRLRPRPLKHLMLCLNVPFFANLTMLPTRSPAIPDLLYCDRFRYHELAFMILALYCEANKCGNSRTVLAKSPL